jgi:regulator of protease activity HflC (stomatin/prohibitin superfamily)
LIFLFGSWYTIPAGHKGVVLTFSKPADVAVGEGLHFKIPIIQSVIKMDTRTQKYEADLTAASKDLQDVNTKIAINFHLSPDSVVEVYRTIGVNYAEKLMYPLQQESNKAVTAKFVADELITKRDSVSSDMETMLKEKLRPRGIIVESISIIDFKFSPSFTEAIENKVTMEQNALAAKNKLEQVKYEAEQRIAQAKGEADAIAIQAQAINAQGGKDYVQLQAIAKWDGVLPQYTAGNAVPFIDIGPIATK